MNKLLELMTDTIKALLPATADLAKHLLGASLTAAGRLGKLAFSAVTSRKSKKLLRKGRKALRITALVSGTVTLLSCAGLILSRKK